MHVVDQKNRLILTPYSTNLATHSPLGLQISSQCLPTVQLLVEWTLGPTMKMKRILPKVSRACVLYTIVSDTELAIDATALDTWVLSQLRTLFHNATVDSPLHVQLHAEKTVFFLHLLGLDTTGHSYRPHSKVKYSASTSGIYPPLFLTGTYSLGVYEEYTSCRRHR